MEDLLRTQIQESNRLALPNGLQELMSDISREVLRAQPRNINAFITNYLSALLVTRENLTIAATVCNEVCDGSCCPELEDELRDIGLFEDDIEQAKITIVKYFNKGIVKEKNILMMLIKEANIFEGHLPAVQDAIRRAFLRHQKNHSVIYESSSESGKDEVALAVSHTMQQYRKARPSDASYNQMAGMVQTSYRAYGVTRARSSKEDSDGEETFEWNESVTSAPFNNHKTVPDKFIASPSWPKTSINTVSSTSLAGSYLKLPKYVPYSAIDSNTKLIEFEEAPEKEHANIDYSNEYFSLTKEEKNMNAAIKQKKKTKEGKKRISFDEVKYKTISAASINNADCVSGRPSEEFISDSNYLGTDYNDIVSSKDDETKENLVLKTINASQYRNKNDKMNNGDDGVNNDLDVYSDVLEFDEQIFDTVYEDIENGKDDKKVAYAHEYVSDIEFVETDNICAESENEGTENDKDNLTIDEDVVEADNESDCSVEEVIKMNNNNDESNLTL